MAQRQLIVVVEGTAAMGPFWDSIVSDYLHKIIRNFYGNDVTGQKNSAAVELLLVVFNTHGPQSACLVQRSGWTRDVDVFLHWLSSIRFCGGGFGEVAIAEGLAEALTMFSLASHWTQAQQSGDGQKHCILVAASNPYPLSVPQLPTQNIEQKHGSEVSTENHLFDAEAVAKSYAQCLISLSVISPKQLPKLKAIYTAAKRSSQATDHAVDNVKNPYFLILLSENFLEARAALSRSGTANVSSNQIPLKMDTSGPPMSGTSAISDPPANGSIMNRQSIPISTMPTTIVKVGALSGQRQGQPVFICKLEGYRKATASETLASDWPPTMKIVRLISQDHMNNKQYVGKTDLVVFRSLNQHGFLSQLHERKLCAVIQLPSQTLLLSVSDKVSRLIGMLFPGTWWYSSLKYQASSNNNNSSSCNSNLNNSNNCSSSKC